MSSPGGSIISGKRSRSKRTVSMVSSTLRVVWLIHTTLEGSRTSTWSTSWGPLTTWMWSGASPWVPSTSSWPVWPTRMMS